VTLYLLRLGLGGKWVGGLLWPAVVVHAVLAVWFFIVTLRPTQHAPSGATP